MANKIILLNYGMGNLHSVERKLKRLGANVVVSSLPEDILTANKIILPGVGHFARAMENLTKLNLIDALHEAVLQQQIPILGICLGMQLMAKYSEEGHCKGLGWFNADVVRFKIQDSLKYKVPHMGWNNALQCKKNLIMKGIEPNAEFYFVHSFHFQPYIMDDVLCETNYEYKFCSAVEKENIFGVQFHPEKSHGAGSQMLKGFVDLKI